MPSASLHIDKYKDCLDRVGETGFVETVVPPLVYVNGIPDARLNEVIFFENGVMGIVRALASDSAEVLVFSHEPIKVEMQVARTGEIVKIPVGYDFLGISVNPMGGPLYSNVPTPNAEETRFIDTPAAGIDSREKVTEPFVTGVTVVDLMVPLGTGQRELVVGDRKTGKTAFLMQTLLTQAKRGTICVYAGIGKKKADIRKVEAFVKENKIQDKISLIFSSATDPLGLVYITPYVGMTLAEYFRDKGHNVLLILDDLTTHAKFYREISLVGKRFPGRNSYPGDIFHVHSRLLERAGNFKTEKGANSITCLPVADTVESDISGYIQTNLMSITDGHIYFDQDLFEKGRRPAVNYFLSVTRVGRQTQSRIHWGVNRELSSFLTLYDKTQQFIHFGAELNDGIRSTLATGDRIFELFNQPMGIIIPVNVQIFFFCLLWSGVLGDISVEKSNELLNKIIQKHNVSEEFQKYVRGYVEESKDFNMLLGKISSQYKEILARVNK
ncbi:F0F1 ATP synthase subunit alpha [bacterium]|nr:F0F1 ATP synthase subunit alpha [bacterium]